MVKSKNAVAKPVKLKAWEPIFQLLMTGDAVKKEVLENLLGNALKYKLSAHVLECRLRSGAITRVVKNGTKVVSYQLVNPTDESVLNYWKNRGITINGAKPKKLASKMKDFGAVPIPAPAKMPEVLEVTEITAWA